MRIVEPCVALIGSYDGHEMLRRIELAGRTCYKSEGLITPESAASFVRRLIARGHESVLEHVNVTIRAVCDRGVSHELVRHRIASYSQESTRYVDYENDDIAFLLPPFAGSGQPNEAIDTWVKAIAAAEEAYKSLRAKGCTPQIARSVLPNALKTEIVVTTNLRSWRHFCRLRCSPAAHPQMQQLAKMIRDVLSKLVPPVFEDLVDSE